MRIKKKRLKKDKYFRCQLIEGGIKCMEKG